MKSILMWQFVNHSTVAQHYSTSVLDRQTTAGLHVGIAVAFPPSSSSSSFSRFFCLVQPLRRRFDGPLTGGFGPRDSPRCTPPVFWGDILTAFLQPYFVRLWERVVFTPNDWTGQYYVKHSFALVSASRCAFIVLFIFKRAKDLFF